MVDAIARENEDRSIGRQVAVDQRLGEAAHSRVRLRVGDGPPKALFIPLGEKDAVGRLDGPAVETVGEPDRIRAERMSRLHVDDAAGGVPDVDGGRRDPDLPDAVCLREHHAQTLEAPAAAARDASQSRNVEPSRASRASSGAGAHRGPSSR